MKQPWGISLNCLVLVIAGVASAFGALALITVGTAATSSIAYLTGFGVTNIASYITMGGVFLIVMAIVAFALCYGLWVHDSTAWWICLGLLVLGIVADVIAVVAVGLGYGAFTPITLIVIGVNLILIFGLLHRDTISAVRPDIKYTGWVLES